MLGIKLNLLSPIFGVVKKMVKFSGKVNFTNIILDVLAYIPTVINLFNNFKEKQKDGFSSEDYKTFIDAALEKFDEATGITGLDVIPDLPQNKEEEALDHLKEFMRIMLYNKAGVKGYTESTSTSGSSKGSRKVKDSDTGTV